MKINFEGQVAIVTGAGGGLGKQHALELGRRGAKVVVNDLGGSVDGSGGSASAAELVAQEIRDNGGTAVANDASVTDFDAVQAMVDETVANWGRIDILVNNAGFAKAGAFEAITDDEWQYDLDLKLMAAVRLSRLVLPSMKANRWGRIINMLNSLAKTPAKGSAPTSVTRAAGMALTKVLAGEGAAHNVLVNALNIGRIESDQMVRAYKASGSNDSLKAFIKAAGKSLPMGRLGYADECASLACLLCSDAGGYVSGTAINVDGNLSPAL